MTSDFKIQCVPDYKNFISYENFNSFLATFRHIDTHLQLVTNEDYWLFYNVCLKIKHDALHLLVNNLFYKDFKHERQVNEIYPGYTDFGFNRTPDIHFEIDDLVFFLDVGFSRDVYGTINDKKEKYFHMINDLSSFLSKKVYFFAFVLNHGLTNVDKQIEELNSFFEKTTNKIIKIKNIDVMFLNNVIHVFDTKYTKILENIDKTFFEEMKISNFSKSEMDLQTGIITDSKINLKTMVDIQDEKYPYKPIIGSEENIKEFVSKIYEEKILESFYDTKNDYKKYEECSDKITEKNKEFLSKIKPTNYILYPEKNDILEQKHGKFCEQKMIYNLMVYLEQNLIDGEQEEIIFLKNIITKTKVCLENKYDRQKFEMDDYFYEEPEYKQNYKKLKEENQIDKMLSYRQFLLNKGLINKSFDDDNAFVTGSKTLYIKYNEKQAYKNQWLKSGNLFYKNLDINDVKPTKNTTVPLNMKIAMDNFLNILKNDCDSFFEKELEEFYDFCINKKTEINDSIECNRIKEDMVNQYDDFLKEVLSKRSSKKLWFNHHAYSQLMHFLAFTNKPEEMSFFNCGAPNFLCLVTGGYKSFDNENGKAFRSLVVTDKPDFYNEIYGNCLKFGLKDGNFLIFTNWRRLTQEKCTFCRDMFYSVISTTMSSFFDLGKEHKEYLHELHAIKTIIALSPTQQISEFLMDTRYAYMSSFSSYTNLIKLITQKFSPPYTNVLSVWLIDRLLTRLPIITKSLTETDGVQIYVANYKNDIRTNESIGGKISIPSLWTNKLCTNIQQVVEEIFIYVLTIKEPSNMHHEKINAIKTILEYQQKFNETPDKIKRGYSNCLEDYIDFVDQSKNNEIGFSATVIHHSFRNLIDTIKPNFKKIIDEVLSESIGEMASTKAVIHSLNREIEEIKDKKMRRSIIIRFLKRMNKIEPGEKVLNDEEEEFIVYQTKNDSKIYKRKERQRVWETLIEILEKNDKIETVEDLVDYFFNEQNGKVEADICIKSQYGSKREFYVVNIGAKAAARIVEKFFQKLCIVCPSECISIPGDKKMIKMQKTIDDATKYAQQNKLKLKYVNGDCTKWSAAETLGSFIAMIDSISDKLPVNFYNLIRTTFCCWADKNINIPFDIVTKILPSTKKTQYLGGHGKKNTKISSTQNFLQGMFNYASSIKAVSCNVYVSKLWEVCFPNSKLRCFHLEHSDDYVQIIVYKDEDEFKKFRAIYKIFMKMHGYNDSERKTSCQQLFMEFVSLISFNGQMIYPKIKKTKEINLNLPCTGYKQDIEAALSRQGECLRMGCNVSFCYFFQKAHMFCVREAYSLLKGMKNDFNQNPYMLPIEMFGCPDQLPIFGLYTKGDINNYRLYKYGNDFSRKMLFGLIKKAGEIEDVDMLMLNPENFDNIIYSPKFIHETTVKIVKDIKKYFNINIETVKEYWDLNITDKLIKPIERKRLIEWLKIKFFDRTFIETYTKASRTKMTMRLSRYVGKKIIKMGFFLEEEEGGFEVEWLTIIDSFKQMYNYCLQCEKIFEDKEILRIITKSDPSVATIYSMLNKCNIKTVNYKLRVPMVGCKTPNKTTFLNITNSPGVILQKILNPNNFDKDKRKYISDFSLEKDIKTITTYFNPNKKRNTMEILSLYNDMCVAKYQPIIMIGFSYQKQNIVDHLIDQLTLNTLLEDSYVCKMIESVDVQDPNTGTPFYLMDKYYTISTNQQCLETLTIIYTFLSIRYGFTNDQIKEILNDINFIYQTEEIKYFVDYKEVLKPFTIQYFESTKRNINIQKMAAFLRYVLLDENDIAIMITNDVYSSTYEYIKRAEYTGSKYEGKTICQFKYFNHDFIFYQNDNDNPIMYTNIKNKNINKMAYLMALKLSHVKKDFELEKMHYNYNLNDFLCEPKVYNKKIKAILPFEEDDWVYKDLPSKHIPIILTNEIIKTITHGLKTETQQLLPIIQQKGLCCKVGKQKLFTLPYWECSQYPVCELKNKKNKIYLEGVSLNDILEKRLFEKMMKNKLFSKEDIRDIDYNDSFEFMKKYFSEIKEIKEFVSNYFTNNIIRDFFSIEKEEEVDLEFEEIDFDDIELEELDLEIEENKINETYGNLANEQKTKNYVYNPNLHKENFSDGMLDEDRLDFEEPVITNTTKELSISNYISFEDVEIVTKKPKFVRVISNYLKNILLKRPLIVEFVIREYYTYFTSTITAEQHFYNVKSIDKFFNDNPETKLVFLTLIYILCCDCQVLNCYSPQRSDNIYVTFTKTYHFHKTQIFKNTKKNQTKYNKNKKFFEDHNVFILGKEINYNKSFDEDSYKYVTFFDIGVYKNKLLQKVYVDTEELDPTMFD